MRPTHFAALAAALALACNAEPPPRAAVNAARLTGTLLEQLDGPPYSFLRLQTVGGEVWAAVPAAPAIERSSPISLDGCIQVRAFDAAAIGRRFDQVSFCTLARK